MKLPRVRFAARNMMIVVALTPIVLLSGWVTRDFWPISSSFTEDGPVRAHPPGHEGGRRGGRQGGIDDRIADRVLGDPRDFRGPEVAEDQDAPVGGAGGPGLSEGRLVEADEVVEVDRGGGFVGHAETQGG
jgi:hypothetical protein